MRAFWARLQATAIFELTLGKVKQAAAGPDKVEYLATCPGTVKQTASGPGKVTSRHWRIPYFEKKGEIVWFVWCM